jgi:hypothetical protein
MMEKLSMIPRSAFKYTELRKHCEEHLKIVLIAFPPKNAFFCSNIKKLSQRARTKTWIICAK